jgi:hypothetical protein
VALLVLYLGILLSWSPAQFGPFAQCGMIVLLGPGLAASAREFLLYQFPCLGANPDSHALKIILASKFIKRYYSRDETHTEEDEGSFEQDS